MGKERKGLSERGRPELTLCLALIHHIVMIELVSREDEMVQTLLRNREDQYEDYHEDQFRALLCSATIRMRRARQSG